MLLSLALPALASAQATRTWVSGVGDDANPCSRTAPCKTFAGAIAKTAAGGEIDALDPGGFGAVTITKSITIDGGGGQIASVLVSGTNGIVVAAGPTDQVTLRNLQFNGLSGQGLNGVSFVSGGSLRLEHVNIFGFGLTGGSGVSDTNSGPSSLVISDSTIADNTADGVLIDPTAKASAVIEGTTLEDNACGLVVTTLSGSGGTCGTGTTPTSNSVTVTAMGSSISVNSADGILSTGPGSNVFATSDLVTANGHGLDAQHGGKLVSLCGNAVGGNTTDGAATSTLSTGCASTGPPGVAGATGPRGPAGDIELVTCKAVKVRKHHRTTTKTKCTGKLVSGPVRFTVTGHAVHATLDRAGATVASGTLMVGGASDVGLMSVTGKLRPGDYQLRLWRHGRVTGRQTVLVR